ncbi:hypothetical protein CKO25_11700 [Thiocapsa imhoffii]|uniref:HPt domain-containing protein n=1 Tax=Thiocapsa imhoffii TaxID=382777 RepID=A0A9X1B9R6_9GAMM|nr:Hpt domain-containing protein [Thiocapsa imhoffii]MBK1645291.1 hypothetical protein [Thiocapsa imhoffii]
MDDPNLQTGPLPVRDAALALEQTGGDAALAEELFSALLDGLPDELAQLAVCHHESDWVGLAEYAHQIRGATRYCGVPALDAAVATLERTARLGDSVLIEDGMTGVTTEVDRLFAIARPHPGAT